MFTGLIEEVGRVIARRGARLHIRAPRIGKRICVGESVAVNGCCLTATARTHRFMADNNGGGGSQSKKVDVNVKAPAVPGKSP